MKLFLWALALISAIAVTACSSSNKNPEKVAEARYLHYFNGSKPGPNDEYAKYPMSESQKKEFQQLLEQSHKNNLEEYGPYKRYEVISKDETPDGNKITLEMEFQHEKKNQTKEYTLLKSSDGSWTVK